VSSSRRIQIRGWRVTQQEAGGLSVWFDPSTEFVRLYRLPLHNGEAAPEQLAEGVDTPGESGELDKVVSVSELEAEADAPSGSQINFILTRGSDDLPF